MFAIYDAESGRFLEHLSVLSEETLQDVAERHKVSSLYYKDVVRGKVYPTWKRKENEQ